MYERHAVSQIPPMLAASCTPSHRTLESLAEGRGNCGMIYVFGDYELDTTLYELRYAGEPRKMEPRVFNVLAYLIQHRDHVVSREELLDHLWPGLFTSESLLNNCIMEARKAVADNGQVQRVIRTIHGRGYRFIAPMAEPREEHPPRALLCPPKSPWPPCHHPRSGWRPSHP